MAKDNSASDSHQRLTLSISEAAVRLGISRNSCYLAARTGQLPTIIIGRRILVPTAALNRLLENGEMKELNDAGKSHRSS